MTSPIKDNEHIRADQKAFMDAYQRAREQLGTIEGVVGIGYGLKEKAGIFTSDLVILVYVIEKKPGDALSPEHRIPPTFEGYQTDVRVSLPVETLGFRCNDETPYSPIAGGIRIEAANPKTPIWPPPGGTLGCIVQKRRDHGDDNAYLLTCAHVLLDEDLKTKHGDGVYHPFLPRATPEMRKGTMLGKIDRQYVRKGHVDTSGKAVRNEPSVDPPPDRSSIDPTFTGIYVDCAAVRLELGSFCCGSACTRGDIQFEVKIPNLLPPPTNAPTTYDRTPVALTGVRDLRNEPASGGTRVIKNGFKTTRTVGVITGVMAPAHSIKFDKVVRFSYNTIEIALEPAELINFCTATNAFSDHGDSGSLIVDEQYRAVGLLFAQSEVANSAGAFLTYACHIVPVLDTLGMCIPTASPDTSHGSSNATDGSGLALYSGESELLQDDGKVLFSKHGVAGTARTKNAGPALAAVTEAERARMLPLLDALRETERGRELHEDFTQLSREIAYLVRRCRPVTVTWHRNRGPAFLACILNHLKGEPASIPEEIGEISRTMLLTRMGKVLQQHGSNPLRHAIERHGGLVPLFADATSAQQCIELLRDLDSTEVSA